MFGIGFLGKTHIPHRKNTADMPAVEIAPPKQVLLPLSQHIGAPAKPLVKLGDEVKVGQKIAEADGFVSSAVYASISGKVEKTEEYLRPDGRKVWAIRITGDGLMTPDENIKPPDIRDLDSFISAVRESGVVGLGGAGFPTAVKLDAVKKGLIDTVVINGAECEPYITSDTRTMLDCTHYVKRGIELLEQYVPNVREIVFGIEKNKPKCIQKLSEVFSGDAKVRIQPLPSTYPQGAEKVIIYNTVKRTVPQGKLPADAGVLVLNVTTLSAIAEYIDTGMPLVRKCITVDGSAVREPKNLTVPIGTAISELSEYVGGFSEDVGKVLYGGPMMGICVDSLSEPVLKNTNAVTVLTRKDSLKADSTACIHCGRCVAACPVKLNPTAYSKALNIESREEKVARLEEYKINLCMECGCCSFVCPARRPLVQNNRLAKATVREYAAHMTSMKQ